MYKLIHRPQTHLDSDTHPVLLAEVHWCVSSPNLIMELENKLLCLSDNEPVFTILRINKFAVRVLTFLTAMPVGGHAGRTWILGLDMPL